MQLVRVELGAEPQQLLRRAVLLAPQDRLDRVAEPVELVGEAGRERLVGLEREQHPADQHPQVARRPVDAAVQPRLRGAGAAAVAAER